MIVSQIKKSIAELVALLTQLSDTQFVMPCAALSNATIGEHSRHIIEMFGCLDLGYSLGTLNYDLRARNLMMQTNTEFAIQNLLLLEENLVKDNKKLFLEIVKDHQKTVVETNYERELWYNFDHCIHHQALIKVAVLMLENIRLAPDFGVAPATIEYRNQNQCVR